MVFYHIENVTKNFKILNISILRFYFKNNLKSDNSNLVFFS
jgi:hypothetical protein